MNIQTITSYAGVLPIALGIAFGIAFFSIFLMPATALATVGGPTLIYSFTYNPTDESVYYMQLDQGGRGCPPTLWKISLATGALAEVFSCDQGEAVREKNGANGEAAVMEEIRKITSTFRNLIPIDLKKNGIAIDVNFLRDEMFPEFSEVMRRHFTATISQRNVRAAEFAVTGCAKDQPFLFSGYAIPGFEKKIVVLSSAKGDCFEGGYISESLHVVGEVSSLDKTAAGDNKGPFPLTQNASALLVYESETPAAVVTSTPQTATSSATTSSDEEPNSEPEGSMKIALFAILAALAIGLGYFAGKFTKRS